MAKKRSDPRPEWFPLRIYGMDFSPQEWAIQIAARLDFRERYITKTDPKWQDDIESKHLESDCKDLPATWERWFISTADPFDESSSVGELSRTDKQMWFSRMIHAAYGQNKQYQAVELMTGTKALQQAAKTSESAELFASAFLELASLYGEALSDSISEGEKQKRLDIIRNGASLWMQVTGSLEHLFEGTGISTVFEQLNYDPNRLWIGLNPELDDEAIHDELRRKLKYFRGEKKERKKVTQAEFDKWKDYGILQIFDLEMWASINNLHFTDPKIAEYACTNKKDAEPVGHLRSTAKQYTYETISRKIVTKLKSASK